MKISKPLAIILFLISISSFSQVEIGLKKMNVFADISYSAPTNELKNQYSLGDLMKFYIGAEVPFAALNYSQKSTMGLSVAALIDHENANFANISTDGLDARITSYGLRVRPFANMAVYAPKGNVIDGHYVKEITHKVTGTDEFGNAKYSEYTTTESLPIWSEEGAKLLVTMFLSGLYVDYGKADITLVEPPFQDVNRIGTMYSIGTSPSLGTGGKITGYMDIGYRQYSWINAMNTTSGIQSWHIGFGVGFNIK